MTKTSWLAIGLVACIAGCGDDGGGTDPEDAGSDASGERCPSGGGTGTLAIEIELESGVAAKVQLEQPAGTAVGDVINASGERMLAAGEYRVRAHRVRKVGEIVGAAYQAPEVSTVCVRAGETATARVAYTREPGSARLWLTQSNGDGAQVMAFDVDQLTALGEQAPRVSLSPALNNVGPIRVDAKGRLWVGTTSGKLVAFNAARMGSTSTGAPDVVLDGPSLCEAVLPCGPRAIAFDAAGALWVATIHRVVKLEPASLERSGQPMAAVTIQSPSAGNPRALAFDASGNLWVADAGGAVVRFNAARLGVANVSGAADVVIFAQQPGPVMIGLGAPEGLVVDGDGNLWVGYFSGNDLVRFKPSELATSALESNPLIPSLHIRVGVEALVTDLALDEGGNLWLPGGAGTVYRIAKDQLSAAEPMLRSMRSAAVGSAEKLAFNTVPGPLFIAP